MALLEKNRVKTITASGGGTLAADADESFRIRDLFCVPSTNDTYLTLSIKGTTVGKIRVKGKSGNHLPFPHVKTAQVYELVTGGLFAWARRLGLDLSIPLASGETLTISRYAEAGYVAVVYDRYDAGDVKPTEPNGSMSPVRRYVHYGENSAAVTGSPASVNTSLIWTGGEQFPFDGSAVAEKNVFRLLAILASPSAHGDGSANKGYSTFLKLIHRNNVLFDEDQNGLPLKGNSAATADAADYTSLGSVIGPLTAENPAPGLWLPDPITLAEGDKLTTQVIVADAAASGIAASELDVAYLMEQTYLS